MKYKESSLIGLYIIISFLISSCNKANQNTTKKNVELFGSGFKNKDLNINAITLNSSQGFFSEPFIEIKIDGDSLNKSFKLDAPEIYGMYPVGDPYFNWNLYISPGDSVHLKMINGFPIFSGKNSANYNLSSVLNNYALIYPNFNGDSNDYFNKCKEIYTKKLKILESYIKDSTKITSGFPSRFRNEFEFEYLSNLILPLKWDSRLDLPSLKKFLGEISFDRFKNEQLLGSFYYKNSLSMYIRYFFAYDKDFYSKAHQAKEYEFIENNLEGKLKEYALASLIYDYSQNLMPETIPGTKDILNKNMSSVHTKAYLNEMMKVDARFHKLENHLPDSILSADLTPLFDNNLNTSFGIILNEGNQKIRIIDFWASWCQPCIKEMKDSHNFRKYLRDKYNVTWLYISIDKKEEEWQNKSNDLKEFIPTKNNFRISEKDTEPLSKFFDLEWIPRYVALNKRGELILDNLPKPSDSIIFNRIIAQISTL